MQLVIKHNVKTSVTAYITSRPISRKTYLHASADDMVGEFSVLSQ